MKQLRLEYLNRNLNFFLRANTITQLYMMPNQEKAFTAWTIQRERQIVRVVYNGIVYDIDLNDVDKICTIDEQDEPARCVWTNPNNYQQILNVEVLHGNAYRKAKSKSVVR